MVKTFAVHIAFSVLSVLMLAAGCAHTDATEKGEAVVNHVGMVADAGAAVPSPWQGYFLVLSAMTHAAAAVYTKINAQPKKPEFSAMPYPPATQPSG